MPHAPRSRAAPASTSATRSGAPRCSSPCTATTSRSPGCSSRRARIPMRRTGARTPPIRQSDIPHIGSLCAPHRPVPGLRHRHRRLPRRRLRDRWCGGHSRRRRSARPVLPEGRQRRLRRHALRPHLRRRPGRPADPLHRRDHRARHPGPQRLQPRPGRADRRVRAGRGASGRRQPGGPRADTAPRRRGGEPSAQGQDLPYGRPLLRFPADPHRPGRVEGGLAEDGGRIGRAR